MLLFSYGVFDGFFAVIALLLLLFIFVCDDNALLLLLVVIVFMMLFRPVLYFPCYCCLCFMLLLWLL